jgi:hypothetical protein
MRFRIAALVTALITVAGVVAGIGFDATSALAISSSDIICTPPNASPSQCINNTAGHATSGNLIQFWQDTPLGLRNNTWEVTLVGTVKSGQGGVLWPFPDGSGLNSRYNNNNVYQLKWYVNQNWCASGYNFDLVGEQGPLQLASCSPGAINQYFVFSKYGFLIPVGPSNRLYNAGNGADNPVWLNGEAGGTANGDLVWMGTDVGLAWSIQAVIPPNG